MIGFMSCLNIAMHFIENMMIIWFQNAHNKTENKTQQ